MGTAAAANNVVAAAPAADATAPATVAAAPAVVTPVASESAKPKKRPGRKPGSKNKPKEVASGATAPTKRAYKRKGQRSVCMAPPVANGVACKKRVTSHGLCSSHAITAKGMVAKGLTTWADLVKAGVAKDKHMTPARKAFLDAVQASKAPVPAPVVSHVVPITPIVTN